MKRHIFIGVIAVFAYVILPNVSIAASLYIDPGMTSLNRGDSMTAKVRLDTDEDSGECINAVDAVLTYSENIDPVDISIGSSILNVWVQQPVIDKANHTISFAGGIPNGYCGRVIGDPRLSNILTEIIFRSPGFTVGGSDETTAFINFTDESTAYLNDGRGTKAALLTYGSSIELSSSPSNVLQNPWKEKVNADVSEPEEFAISLQKDDKAFSNKWYIVFNTTDKQTGIDHYEIIEEPLTQFGAFSWARADAPWLIERSPYILKDQSLNSTIRVKAVDKAGNEYIATMIPDESIRTRSKDEVLTYVAVGAGALVLITFLIVLSLWYRNRKASRSNAEAEDDYGPQDNDVDNGSNNENDYE